MNSKGQLNELVGGRQGFLDGDERRIEPRKPD